MKLTLDKNIRLRIRESGNELEQHRKIISDEIHEKYRNITKALHNHRGDLFKLEQDFIEEVSVLFKTKKIQIGTTLRVVVQVGPNGGDILREHTGTVEKIYDTWKPCFDLSDKNYLEGRKFTIGSSCIQEIEIL